MESCASSKLCFPAPPHWLILKRAVGTLVGARPRNNGHMAIYCAPHLPVDFDRRLALVHAVAAIAGQRTQGLNDAGRPVDERTISFLGSTEPEEQTPVAGR